MTQLSLATITLAIMQIELSSKHPTEWLVKCMSILNAKFNDQILALSLKC